MPFMITGKQRIMIGIDCGVNTGLAVYDYDTRKLVSVQTMKIHKAMEKVKNLILNAEVMLVVVEDARKAVFGRHSELDHNKAQGAGSVKRDSGLWDDYLFDLDVPYQMIRPAKNFTKLTAETFKQITGWEGSSSSHSRDAAMMIYKRKV